MDIALAVDVIWKVGTLIGFGWMYLANRDKVTNTRISKLEQDIDIMLDSHSNRLTSLEVEAKRAPGHGDLAEIHSRINDLTGTLKRIEGEGAAQTRILNLVYESLIDRRKP
jgi:hypothetical protein